MSVIRDMLTPAGAIPTTAEAYPAITTESCVTSFDRHPTDMRHDTQSVHTVLKLVSPRYVAAIFGRALIHLTVVASSASCR